MNLEAFILEFSENTHSLATSRDDHSQEPTL